MKPPRTPSLVLREAVLSGHGVATAGTTTRLSKAAAGPTSPVRQAFLRYWHHGALLVLALVCALAYGPHAGQSWHFFDLGGRLLFCADGTSPSQCGLHLYASHPELQIGPLSLAVAGVAVLLREDGAKVAELVMTLIGLLALVVVEHDARREASDRTRRRLQVRTLLAGIVFVPAWVDLSVRFAHLDDVLALLFTALAVRAVARGGSSVVGILLAAAVLSKPWAIAFVPLVFAVPRGRRLVALAWAVVPIAVVAAVFLVGDPNTTAAGGFGIPNAPSSSLRVLGVNAGTTPAWDRPAQFVLGFAVGVVAVARGRWAAVVMAAAAVRIALDPGVYSYYTAAILLGTVVWDVQARKGRVVPLWSWIVFVALFLCRYLPLQPHVLGFLRLGVCVAVIVASVFLSRPLGLILPPGLMGRRPRGVGDS